MQDRSRPVELTADTTKHISIAHVEAYGAAENHESSVSHVSMLQEDLGENEQQLQVA